MAALNQDLCQSPSDIIQDLIPETLETVLLQKLFVPYIQTKNLVPENACLVTVWYGWYGQVCMCHFAQGIK